MTWNEVNNDHVDSVLIWYLMAEWLTGSFCAEENALVEIRRPRFNTNAKRHGRFTPFSPDSGPPWCPGWSWSLWRNSSLSSCPLSTCFGSSSVSSRIPSQLATRFVTTKSLHAIPASLESNPSSKGWRWTSWCESNKAGRASKINPAGQSHAVMDSKLHLKICRLLKNTLGSSSENL